MNFIEVEYYKWNVTTLIVDTGVILFLTNDFFYMHFSIDFLFLQNVSFIGVKSTVLFNENFVR